jgi:hypothetical protein
MMVSVGLTMDDALPNAVAQPMLLKDAALQLSSERAEGAATFACSVICFTPYGGMSSSLSYANGLKYTYARTAILQYKLYAACPAIITGAAVACPVLSTLPKIGDFDRVAHAVVCVDGALQPGHGGRVGQERVVARGVRRLVHRCSRIDTGPLVLEDARQQHRGGLAQWDLRLRGIHLVCEASEKGRKEHAAHWQAPVNSWASIAVPADKHHA